MIQVKTIFCCYSVAHFSSLFFYLGALLVLLGHHILLLYCSTFQFIILLPGGAVSTPGPSYFGVILQHILVHYSSTWGLCWYSWAIIYQCYIVVFSSLFSYLGALLVLLGHHISVFYCSFQFIILLPGGAVGTPWPLYFGVIMQHILVHYSPTFGH